MCGIFAYSGSHNAKETLIEGLKNLEYRGYDSAGIAFFEKNQIHCFRVCGGVNELEQKIKSSHSHKSSLGIGHTRWATHGAPSEKNAHPHKSHSIYVVHNGVIENEEELRKIIDSKHFLSDTDTELIPHLIYHFYKKEQLDFPQSLLKTANWIKGSYAVVVICEERPGEIFAFKSGPPLVFYKREDEFFISSDPYSSGKQASEMIFLEDEELLIITKNQFQLFNFKGEKVFREFKKLSHDRINSEKGPHPHFMLKEILEQPQTLSHLITTHTNKDKNSFHLNISKGNQKKFDSLLKASSELLILACGSSYHSALFAKYFLEDIAKIKVSVEIASEFIYRKSFVSEQTLALFISQSGETADILTALKQIQTWKLHHISLCNVENSSLDRKSEFSLSMLAGHEVAVASTKTFSASLMLLSFLAFHRAKLKGYLDPEKEESFLKPFLNLPAQVEHVLQCDQFFLQIMEKLKKFQSFFYLGRGLYYPIALEGALKLKEVAYLYAEAYPSGEMKHGPLAMIDKNTAVVALLPCTGVLYKKSMVNFKEAKSRGACIIAIGGKEQDDELKTISDYHLPLPENHELNHLFLTLIPLQMMAYYISRSYGYNVDRPRNLAKSVTVE